MNSPILELNQISAWYGSNGDRTEVMRDVSLAIKAGEVVGVLGPNGCGKSTLLRVIGGLHEDYTGDTVVSCDEPFNRPCALVPQDFRSSFFTWASLRQNVKLVQRMATNKSQIVKPPSILDTAEQLGIDVDLSLRPQECSGGMLQQAAILRACSVRSSLILADEPFSALDVSVARRIRRAFRSFIRKQNRAAVLVLHDIEDLADTCDRILVIPSRPFTTATTCDNGYFTASFTANRIRRQSSEKDAVPFVEMVGRLFSEELGDG